MPEMPLLWAFTANKLSCQRAREPWGKPKDALMGVGATQLGVGAANRVGGLRSGRAKQGSVGRPTRMRCRLSPTADVPSHTSGAATCHKRP
jgi:hypothetical protein